MVLDDQTQATNCKVLARKVIPKPYQLSRVLDSLTPGTFPQLSLTLIQPHVEVNMQASLQFWGEANK